MSFLKNFLSEMVGDNAADALSSVASKITKKAGEKAAQGAINATAEKATEYAVKRTIDKAANALNRPSSLQTPPPPPVPAFESLSVMVAVNGETYGPYEKNTLLEMVRNGSLTRETYVFMDGMSEWKKATEVDQIASLFGATAPAPPAPPKPWANSKNVKSDDSESDNSFSPRLNKLITAAIADGEISDLERQVLIRNAQEEGVAMDEFVMVLEARLYEQRRALTQQEEEKKHRAESLKIQQQAAERQVAPSPVPSTNSNKSNKCPHCGAPINTMSTTCPECGHDYTEENFTASSAWEKLSQQLQQIDNEKPTGFAGAYMAFMSGGDADKDRAKISKKTTIIRNFPLPSDKKSLFDFFISCATIANEGNFLTRSPLSKAYKTKAEQVLVKARIIMKDDTKMLNEINELAKQYKIKA